MYDALSVLLKPLSQHITSYVKFKRTLQYTLYTHTHLFLSLYKSPNGNFVDNPPPATAVQHTRLKRGMSRCLHLDSLALDGEVVPGQFLGQLKEALRLFRWTNHSSGVGIAAAAAFAEAAAVYLALSRFSATLGQKALGIQMEEVREVMRGIVVLHS